MRICLITGSLGLVGEESVEFFSDKFDRIVGIDNDMRSYFFGNTASNKTKAKKLIDNITNYEHHDIDIRNIDYLEKIFLKYGTDIKLIVHTAAQPSHEWASSDPVTDFTINANGTLNLLEMTRKHCRDAVFILTSTNKVYGENPNYLPLEENEKRWEISKDHVYFNKGIDESMSVDQTTHSLFGTSKLASDILTQEYGRYFGLHTGIFRAGCISGPKHSGAEQHGFLNYMMKCAVNNDKYTIFGYKGKQVRDNIHSIDLVNMFWDFYKKPKQGEVYNAGGGRLSNCSVLEAIEMCERITGKKMLCEYSEKNRIGDHVWWISDSSKFKSHYPAWEITHGTYDILDQIHKSLTS